MLPLSSEAIEEKNKLSSSGSWLILLNLTLSDNETVIRLVRNTGTSDVVWNGNAYQNFPFEVDEIKEESGGEHSVLNVRVSNVAKSLMVYLEDEKGLVGCSLDLYVVHSDHLDLSTPEVDESFIVTKTSADVMWVTFELSAANLFNVQFPDNRYMRNWCRFRFNYPDGTDKRCGWTGSGFQTCEKTLSACGDRNNYARFGGFPGIPEGGLYTNN